MVQLSISKPISFGSSNNINMLFYVYMRLTHHWLLGYSQHKKILVRICKHAPKWYLLPVRSHFYNMCGYRMCTSHGNRIRNDICFHYTSLCLFFFSRNIGYFLQYKKSNFPLGGKIVASEFANLFYEALDRHDSQRVQSFHQILLRKGRNHQLSSLLSAHLGFPVTRPNTSP